MDIEEHFSKDRDVVKVKFIGKQRGSNMFKLTVTAAWQANQMRSFHTIRGVDLEVESRIRRPSSLEGDSFCTGGNLSRESQNLDKSGSMSGGDSGRPGGSLLRKAEETDGRERKGWWNKHFVKQRGTEENWGLRVEGNAVKQKDQQPQYRSGLRGLQDGNIGSTRLVPEDGAPSTTRETLTTGEMVEHMDKLSVAFSMITKWPSGKAPKLFSNLLEQGHHGNSSNIPEDLRR